MNSKFIPYGQQWIDKDDISEVTKVLSSNLLTSGPYTERFEQAFAKYVDVKYAIVCSSGTAALHLASLSIGLNNTTSVVVPSMSFLATANAPHYTGSAINFSDVDPLSGLITPETFLKVIKSTKKKIKAVFVVHLNGNSADMVSISKIAKEHDILIIEDACHALGSKLINKKKVGSCEFSKISTFSFHPVKTIAMGEGGIITTNDKNIYEKISILRNHGIEKNHNLLSKNHFAFDEEKKISPWYYQMRNVGYNYRASEIHCALGLSQLRKIEKFSKIRTSIVKKYVNALEKYYPYVKIVKQTKHSIPCFHLFVIHINFKKFNLTRSKLIQKLKTLGIGTQVHYIPIYKQPYWNNINKNLFLPGAEKYYEGCLSLPLFPKMTNNQLDYVISTLEDIFNKSIEK